VDKLGYLGSKSVSGAYQAIIASMPPHDVYIEAFLGSGAIMRRKPVAISSIGIDLDSLQNCIALAHPIA
jgi:site-specific DNA-adenine methylase